MALSFLYRLIRQVIEALSVHRMDAVAKDAEILVLRHQTISSGSPSRLVESFAINRSTDHRLRMTSRA